MEDTTSNINMSNNDFGYLNCLLKQQVVIEPHELNKDLNKCILRKLKQEVENKCIAEGFVKEGSVKIIKKTMGYYPSNLFTGSTCIMVYYTADIINPPNGSKIKCTIKYINKLGIQAEHGPLLIIVAKEFHNNKKFFKNKKLGEKIEVVILDKKYNVNDKIISVAAKFDENNFEYNEFDLEEDLKNVNVKSIPMSSVNFDDDEAINSDIDLSILNSSDEDLDEDIMEEMKNEKKKIKLDKTKPTITNEGVNIIKKNNEEIDLIDEITDEDSDEGEISYGDSEKSDDDEETDDKESEDNEETDEEESDEEESDDEEESNVEETKKSKNKDENKDGESKDAKSNEFENTSSNEETTDIETTDESSSEEESSSDEK